MKAVDVTRIGVAVAAMLAVLFLLGRSALPQTNPNCTEFGFQISNACCCTNGCCREADPGEVVHVEDDLYRIVPSGQIIKRTGWSPDGRTVRCSCDLDVTTGKWVQHPKAQTRCLYMPMPSS
jgi:hypothetical protein